MSTPPDQPPPGGWPAPPGWTAPPPGPPGGGPGLNLPPGWGGQPPAAAQPGVIPLRPLALDDFFSGTFRTLRGNWRPLLAVSALVSAVVALLSIPVAVNAHDVVRTFLDTTTLSASTSDVELEAAFNDLVDATVAFLPWFLYWAILAYAALVFVDAGISFVVSRAVLGKSTSAAAAISALVKRGVHLAGLALLITLSILAGYLLCLVPGVILSLMLFAAPSVSVLEGASITTSYKRSLQITSRSFWRVVGILLLVQLLFGLAMQVVSSPLSFLAGFGSLGSASSSEISNVPIGLLVASYVGLWLFSLLCYPLVSVGKTLLYIDQRMRHEGLADSLIASSESHSGRQ